MAAVGFAMELLELYQTAFVGTPNVNMFVSTSVTVPKLNAARLVIVETGGSGVDYVQNKDMVNETHVTAQVMVYAPDYEKARLMAMNAWRVSSKFNFTVAGVKYLSLRSLQGQPINLPVDLQGNSRCSFNVLAVKEPS